VCFPERIRKYDGSDETHPCEVIQLFGSVARFSTNSILKQRGARNCTALHYNPVQLCDNEHENAMRIFLIIGTVLLLSPQCVTVLVYEVNYSWFAKAE
jgi:hypothetical protein